MINRKMVDLLGEHIGHYVSVRSSPLFGFARFGPTPGPISKRKHDDYE